MRPKTIEKMKQVQEIMKAQNLSAGDAAKQIGWTPKAFYLTTARYRKEVAKAERTKLKAKPVKLELPPNPAPVMSKLVAFVGTPADVLSALREVLQ